jgi:hypothetical protein
VPQAKRVVKFAHTCRVYLLATPYRDRQLLRLREEILDLEDFSESVALNEFTLDDFRIELAKYIESNRKLLEDAPLGLYTVVPPNPEYQVKAVEDLLPELLPLSEQCFDRLTTDLIPMRERIVEHIASICLLCSRKQARGCWLHQFLRSVTVTDRIAFAEAIRKDLWDLDPDKAARIWSNWLNCQTIADYGDLPAIIRELAKEPTTHAILRDVLDYMAAKGSDVVSDLRTAISVPADPKGVSLAGAMPTGATAGLGL